MKKSKQFRPTTFCLSAKLKVSLMLLLMLTLVPQGAWALGGSGTSGSPYTIANASDLVAFANKVNGTEQGAYAKLTADITLTSAWTAMGTSSKPYTGTFDGNGKIISGLKLTATAANAGLFGCVNGATIKNFSLAGTVSSGYDNTGSVVGYAKGSSTIQDIVSTVNITMTAAKSHLGGIAGNIENGTSVLGCTYSGTLNAGSSTDSNGGIVGFANANCSGTIKYCFFNGTIKTTGSGPQMGGILGYTNDESNNFGGVQDCYSCGTLTYSGSDTHVNAIVGRIRAHATTTINNTYLSGIATRACNTDGPSIPASNKAITISVGTNDSKRAEVIRSYVYPTKTTPTKLKLEVHLLQWCRFTKWSDNNTDDPRIMPLTDNINLTASVENYFFDIIVSCDPEMGTVTGGGHVEAGNHMTLTATPKQGYRFVGWSDGNLENPRLFNAERDMNLTAEFAPVFTITVSSNNDSWGEAVTHEVASGVFIIEADANHGYHFVRWNDGSTVNVRHFYTLERDESFQAIFAPNQYTITVNITSGQSGMGTVSGGGTFDYGTTRTITATPKTHYHFVQWSDGNTNASRQITVEDDATYTATFAIDQHTITVQANNDDYGTVTGGGTYNYGTQHTITATPKSGHLFVQWNDGNTNASRTITVNSNATYTATFNRIEAKAVFNNGTLTFYYDGINHDGTTYAVTGNPDWKTETITSVVFDASFAAARPTSCNRWFYNQSNLQSITSLQYLNTSEVEDMNHMFYKCSNLTSLDLSNFNTAQVKYMNDMFSGCSKLTSLDLSSFNTESVTRMDYMFDACTRLASLTIGNFDMQLVTYTDCMFKSCYALNTLTMKSVPFLKNQTFNTQFSGDGKTVNLVLDENSVIYEGTNYLPTITNCNHYNQTTPVHVDATCTSEGYDAKICSYCHNEFDKEIIPATHQWGDDHTCTVCHQPATIAHTGNSGTCTWTIYEDGRMIIAPTEGETGVLGTWYRTDEVPWYEYRSEITSVKFEGKVRARTCYDMFVNCSNLTSIDFGDFNTEDVEYMDYMFFGCSSLQSLDLSGFNTTSVIDMQDMFFGCSSLQSLDLSGFNTKSVIDISKMFSGCSSLQELDLSDFNTTSVRSMDSMFKNCSELATLKLSADFVYAGNYGMNNIFEGCGNSDNICSVYYLLDLKTRNLFERFISFSRENVELVSSVLVKDGLPFNFTYEYDAFQGKEAVLTRTFAAQKPSTLMLPFDAVTEHISGAKFYEFQDMKYENNEWVADMHETQNTLIKAYTPYIVVLDEGNTSISFSDWLYFYKTPSELYNTTQGDWTFVALNETKTWEEGDPELGRAYLVAEDNNANADDNGSLNVELVKIEAGTTLKAGRCYFLMNEMPTIKGDINGDGFITVADLTLLIEILNGRATDTTGNADVDGKNGVTIDDVEALTDILLSTQSSDAPDAGGESPEPEDGES